MGVPHTPARTRAGVSMLVLLRGDYPYPAKDGEEALDKGGAYARNNVLGKLMVSETNQLKTMGVISAECHRVMLSCFNTVPAERPTAAALLADPWFTAGAPYPEPVRPATPPAHAARQRASDALACVRACRVRYCCVRRCVRSRVRRRRCKRRRTWRASSRSCMSSKFCSRAPLARWRAARIMCVRLV